MSGTWRSRHWRPDESASAQPTPDRASSREKWSNRQQQERFDQYPREADSNRGQINHQRQSIVDENKEWRRGQRLPSPPRDAGRRAGRENDSRTRDGRRMNEPKQQTTNPIKSDNAERKRATFSTAPPNAWGKPSQSFQSVKNEPSAQINATDPSENKVKRIPNQADALTKTNSVGKVNDNKTKKEAMSFKPAAVASSAQTTTNKPLKASKSPWAKLEPQARKTPNETVFPSLTDGNADTSKSTTAASSQPKATAPISLPTTSLWGKSTVKSIPIVTPGEMKITVDKSKSKDFPSLSTSSSAPRSTQQQFTFQTPSIVTPAPATSNKGKVRSKTSNLSSFLPPQLNTKKNKSRSTSTKSVTAIKKTTGVKRTAASHKIHLHPSIKDNGTPVLKKGRQRLTPKKKKLTTLKKRVLEERLRVWKERNGEGDVSGQHDNTTSQGEILQSSSTILIENFVRPEEDDLVDNDEYDEIVSNVVSLAGRVGRVVSAFVPRPNVSPGSDLSEVSKDIASLESKHVGATFVKFSSGKDASAGLDILNGVIVGGQKICVSLLKVDRDAAEEVFDEAKWKLAVLQSMERRPHSVNQNQVSSASKQGMVIDPTTLNTIIFHNILTDDDYEDEEALAESLEDISSLSRQYGQVVNARASTTGTDKGNVYVSYADEKTAEKAALEMNGILIGGSKVLVTTQVESPHFKAHSGVVEVILENILNDNDYDEEDCLNESLEDISNIARRFGVIGRVYADTSGEHKGRVHIEFLEGEQAAQSAAKQLNGMLIGGLAVSASTSSLPTEAPAANKDAQVEEPPPPIYSGDKIIPERFAACKRVPKIPNSGPRDYAVKINDDRALPLLIEMLGELMRLQERSKDDKNARARRRLVMGLREVARGIRAHKVKMVVMANNLDEYGAIDAKLQEILDIARSEEVPVVFEFNKRKLGKALGKSIKVSVVGIQSADGAQEQFKKLRKILGVA